MRRGTPILAVTALAAALVLGGCGSDSKNDTASGDTGSSSAAPKASITLAVAPDFFYPEFYLGKEKGFFDKQNIDAKIVEFPSGVEGGQAVAGGQADITNMTYVFAGTLGAKGVPAHVIGTNSVSKDWMGMVAAKGIDKPEDLYGKTVATQWGSIDDYFFRKYVAQHNLDLSKIKYQNVKFAQLVPAFAKGQFDVVLNFEPATTKAAAIKPGAHVLARGGDDDLAPLIGYFVAGKKIYENPDLAVRVLKAFDETEKWMNDHPDDVATFLSQKTGITDMAAVKKIMGLIHYEVGLDQQAIDQMQAAVDFLVQQKLVPKTVDVTTFVDKDFVTQAKS